MRKTILVGIVIASAFIIGVLSANPVADAMAGWKFALDEHARDASTHHDTPESQVYEVSGVSVIPPVVESGDEVGSPVQLRCLDGDWFQKPVVLSTNAIPVDRTDIRIIGKGNFVLESEQGIEEEFEKTIGWDGFAEIEFLDSTTFSDIPVTITGLCVSPVS